MGGCRYSVGDRATIGGVQAQQSTDKAKEAGKATSADNRRPSSLSGKREGEMIGEVPVVMMVPMQASNDLAMEKGCWAKLYDKKNFQGDSLLLVGPINLARMLVSTGRTRFAASKLDPGLILLSSITAILG